MKCPVRLCVGIQIFFACLILYMIRVSMSISLLAMVKEGKQSKNTTSECITEILDVNATIGPLPDYGPRYDWNRYDQGLVLGSYYLGYLLTSAPGGYLADRLGATVVTFYTTIFGAILTGIIPLAAMAHVWVVIALRFLTGLTSGVIYPALQSLIARWAPPAEKGKFVAALMGNTLGVVITLPLLGIITETIGWAWSCIIPGIVAVVWSIIWFFTVDDSPSTHKFISEEERDYINDSLSGGVKKVKKAPPILKILSNVPFWALLLAHFGNLWGLYLLLNNGPMYMKEALGFKITKSGALAAAPHLARLIFGLIFGSIGDYLKKTEKLSVTMIRKLFTVFSHVIPGLLILLTLLAGCNAEFAISMIVLSLGFNGASTITNLQNCQDLAPNFAGTIYGFINFFGSITGFIIPPIVSHITKEKSGIKEWNIIFAIGGSMYIGCGLIFIAFGSGKKQPFNDVETETPQAN